MRGLIAPALVLVNIVALQDVQLIDMRKIRIFVFEVVLVAIVIGWVVNSYPAPIGAILPIFLLGILWHITWEILQTKAARHVGVAFGRKVNQMVAWPLVFLLGGSISVLYWWGINHSLKRLATRQATVAGQQTQLVKDGTPASTSSPQSVLKAISQQSLQSSPASQKTAIAAKKQKDLHPKPAPIVPKPSLQTASQTTINAQNSIVVSGGSVGTATVNNFSPPRRGLTLLQEATFVSSLQALPPTAKITVKTVDGNNEAFTYADQFQKSLNNTGHAKNPSVELGLFWRPTPMGLHIVSRSDQDPAAAYRDNLIEKLASVGINAERNIGEWVPQGELYIVVGLQQ